MAPPPRVPGVHPALRPPAPDAPPLPHPQAPDAPPLPHPQAPDALPLLHPQAPDALPLLPPAPDAPETPPLPAPDALPPFRSRARGALQVSPRTGTSLAWEPATPPRTWGEAEACRAWQEARVPAERLADPPGSHRRSWEAWGVAPPPRAYQRPWSPPWRVPQQERALEGLPGGPHPRRARGASPSSSGSPHPLAGASRPSPGALGGACPMPRSPSSCGPSVSPPRADAAPAWWWWWSEPHRTEDKLRRPPGSACRTADSTWRCMLARNRRKVSARGVFPAGREEPPRTRCRREIPCWTQGTAARSVPERDPPLNARNRREGDPRGTSLAGGAALSGSRRPRCRCSYCWSSNPPGWCSR